jgi:hypothetical protein
MSVVTFPPYPHERFVLHVSLPQSLENAVGIMKRVGRIVASKIDRMPTF